MRQGTFLRMEGQRFVLQTDRGEWKMYGARGLQPPAPNSPIRFVAEKEPARDGREYYRLQEIYVDAQAPLGSGQGAPTSQDPEVARLERELEERKRAAAAKVAEQERLHPTTGTRDRTHPDDARQMFVMGVVGRAMGSGNFDCDQIPRLTAWAANAWERVMEYGERPAKAPAPKRQEQPWPGPNGPEPANPQEAPPQPAYQQYGNPEPPAWDREPQGMPEAPPHEEDGR